MTEEEPNVVTSLPSRPLTEEEGDRLDARESESSSLRPESHLVLDDRTIYIALRATNPDSGTTHLLGYSQDDEQWVVVETWPTEDLDDDEFYHRLDAWEAKAYGHRPGSPSE